MRDAVAAAAAAKSVSAVAYFVAGRVFEAIRYQALNEHLHCVSTLLSSRIFTADSPACDQATESVPADPK